MALLGPVPTSSRPMLNTSRPLSQFWMNRPTPTAMTRVAKPGFPPTWEAFVSRTPREDCDCEKHICMFVKVPTRYHVLARYNNTTNHITTHGAVHRSIRPASTASTHVQNAFPQIRAKDGTFPTMQRQFCFSYLLTDGSKCQNKAYCKLTIFPQQAMRVCTDLTTIEGFPLTQLKV